MLYGHKQSVDVVFFLPDGATLATASKDDSIRFWDVVTCEEYFNFERELGGIVDVSLSANGKVLGLGLDDDTIRVWDSRTGK